MEIRIEVSDENMDELKRLMEITDLKSYRELFNDSLTLLQWAAHEIAEGRTIASMDEEGRTYKEVILRGLERLQRQKIRAASARAL